MGKRNVMVTLKLFELPLPTSFVDCSISHSSRIKLPILLIVQYHYIWWSRPFQAVNPKVMVSYIIVNF